MKQRKKVYAKDGDFQAVRAKRRRIAVVFCFFALGFVSLVARAVYLHTNQGTQIQKIAKNQYTTKIEESPPRGNIYDASAQELAVSVPAYSVAVRPGRLSDKPEAVAKLQALLGMSEKDFKAKLDPAKKYVWLKRYITPREKEDISALVESTSLGTRDAVEIVKGSKRFYPNREFASQILGAVGRDSEGLSGLELFYDRTLQGSVESSTAFRDARGKMFETVETLDEGKVVREPHDLHLTIHKNIQYSAEKELSAACQKNKAKSCTAIVIEPKSGAVLAMASYPSFNPNSYGDYEASRWRNIAVTDAFEPGSTFKTIMAAAAIENGVVSPNDQFFCEGGDLKIGDHTIHDHEKYGMMSVRDIIKVSSNIGIYKVGKKLGRERFADIVSKFGFGKKMGIDYPGEINGFMRPVKSWQEIDFANISFGQGILTTPLQMASSYATIANGGVRMKPYMVASVTDHEGRVLEKNGPQEVGRVLKPQTARLMIDIMKEVTREGGTATRAALPGYSVAGKTGTAQKVVGGRYSHDKFVASFVGIVPAEEPRLVVLVTVDEPKGDIYGGLVAAPIFREIAWAALTDLGIPSSSPVPTADPIMKTASLKAADKTSEKKAQPDGVSAVLKTAQVAFRNAAQNTVNTSTQASLLSPGISPAAFSGRVEEGGLPDFKGMSKRSVLAVLDRRALRCELVGSGIVRSQTPAPGSRTDRDCRIYFGVE